MINKIIRNFLAKQAAGRSDDGIMITLRDPQKVDFQTSMMQDLLMRRGIDPNSITSEKQLVGIINQIKAMEKAEDAAQSGIRNTESAKVFNRAGEELDPNKPIIGGTQEGKKIDQDTFIRLAETNTQRMKQKIADKKIDDDLPPPGSRGGPEDIAAPVQTPEEYLKNVIEGENKKNIAKIKQRQTMLNEAIDDASPGFSGDRKVDADLVAENLAERMGLVYDDLPTKQRLDLYDQAYTGLSKKRFDPPEDFAKGGIARIGLKDGMNRRTFLKLLSGAAAIPIVGKFFKIGKVGKTVTKVPVIKTADVPGKPEWFDALVNKVILEGDDVTKQFATKERQIVHTTKIDNQVGGPEVRVTQDLDDGVIRVEYDSVDNMGEETVQLQFKPGIADESTGGKKPRDEFEVSEVEPQYVGGPDDADIEFVGEASGPGLEFISSDVSKLKQYATGKGPTMKEFLKIKKRKDDVKKINEDTMEQAEYIAGKYGDEPQPDDLYEINKDNFASGGIARMLGE